MPLIVTPITFADIPGAIDSIQQAFDDDPYNRWVFSDRDTFSHARNRVSLRIRCEWGMRNALFYVAKDDSIKDEAGNDRVLGVAMWLPPREAGKTESWGEWVDGWLLWGKQVWMNLTWGRGGLNVKRYYIWKTNQAVAQKELWDDPHGYYFCNIVTVLPSQQGKGIGKMLFKVVTDQADKERRKCYLESSRDKPNTIIYEKMGFKKVKEMECNDEGAICKLYCMIRDPQPRLTSETSQPTT